MVFRALVKAGTYKNMHKNFQTLIFASYKTSSIVVITKKSQNFVVVTFCKIFLKFHGVRGATLIFSVLRTFKGLN